MRILLATLIVLILGTLYANTIAPDLTWSHFSADGGDFISAAATGGVPHPTGYPLYLVLARIFQSLPLGSLAFRTNLLSSISTLFCALVLFFFLLRLLPAGPLSQISSFLAVMWYGLAPWVWGQALVTEVYALHSLLILFCLVIMQAQNFKAVEWIRGGIFGVAATNHLTSIMVFPILILGNDKTVIASQSQILKRGVGVLCGLSLYALLPIRASYDPPVNWGDASTWNGFLWLVSGQIYHEYSFGLSVLDAVGRLRAFAGLLLEQFSWVGTFLGLYGLISLVPIRIMGMTVWVAGCFLFYSVTYGSFDSQVNLMPVWLVFAIWIAYGIQSLLSMISIRWKQGVLVLAILIFMGIRVPTLYVFVDLSNDFQARDFVTYAVRDLPRDALVFVYGDGPLFSLWYAQFVLGHRLDVAVISEGLLPFTWYIEMLRRNYPYILIPEDAVIELPDLRTANPNRTVCYIENDGLLSCP